MVELVEKAQVNCEFNAIKQTCVVVMFPVGEMCSDDEHFSKMSVLLVDCLSFNENMKNLNGKNVFDHTMTNSVHSQLLPVSTFS